MAVANQVLDQMGYEDDDSYATDAVAYLPVGEMSIPVPKSFGKMVKKYYDDGKEAIRIDHQKWDRAFQLYRQCGDEGNINLDDGSSYPYHFENEADENIIRSNVRTIMRSTYMQNPHFELTDVTTDELAESLEYIVTFMLNKRSYPGLNLKPKARRWVLHAQLTNFAVLRLDFQAREGSRQEAVDELHAIEAKMEKAKSQKELKECYAHLEALHERMPLANDKGLMISNVMPQNIIVDPNCTLIDLSDADWLIEEFDMDRTFMRETYYQKDEDGVYRLRANPNATTEVVEDSNTTDVKEKVVDTVINARTQEQQELLAKDTVRCAYFYDKRLRRCSLFNTEDWTHPLYVEDDTMLLSRFFRHFILAFGETVDGIVQPGEISYYVGQVNEVNKINRKAKSIRDTIFNTIVYDRGKSDAKEITKLVNHLRNPRQVRAFGIANNTEGKISDILEALVPPAFQFKEMFDTTNLRQQIDRAASISEIERGQQFRTNTTNQQVNFYAENKEETTGVLRDAIEDCLDDLGWSICEMLVSKYSKEEIIEMVGPQKGAAFEQMTVQEFNQRYRMQVASGSIEKPTSEYKKKEALNIAQAIGQVGQAAPGATLRIMLKLFQTAFSSLVVKKEDWAQLDQETQANLQKGVSTDAPPAAG